MFLLLTLNMQLPAAKDQVEEKVRSAIVYRYTYSDLLRKNILPLLEYANTGELQI